MSETLLHKNFDRRAVSVEHGGVEVGEIRPSLIVPGGTEYRRTGEPEWYCTLPSPISFDSAIKRLTGPN